MNCDRDLEELGALDRALSEGGSALVHFKRALDDGTQRQHAAFAAGCPVTELVEERARLIDGLLVRVWTRNLREWSERLALVAVGGYGRGQLHPGSDIDVMVLTDSADIDTAPWRTHVADFVTMLWDLGLEVGHSVRTPEQCVTESQADVTVVTSLMESRLLHGPLTLFEKMRELTDPDHVWPSRAFFEAKLQEQKARHLRYHDTGYNLEPNVKGSPGGLRDIQLVGWVAKRHFGAETLHDLVAEGFLTGPEYEGLIEGREFLWKLRYALHALTGRREDRLLFDHQLALAEQFGYKDSPHTLAVEQMMQRYYRTVIKLSRMNEMLLQLFSEAILNDEAVATPINERFQQHHGNLDVIDDELFSHNPGAMLEVFLLVQRLPQVTGVTARTIRLIRRYRDLIDDDFRNDEDNQAMFLRIMRADNGVTHELRRMNRYGVLGRYIPAFGRIVGRMQFDLFHAYTVDAHTLFVVSNLRRFALTRFDHEYAYCSQIMQSLGKPELAYLAGLFHDIAKGRGGDHSVLGARDAEVFCLQHGLRPFDAKLVAWLVRHHLDLSITAQKKDINDPLVINEFAALVGDQLHLDFLYVLTVADVRATNPQLFNSWKAQLFEKLYRQTRRALDRGLENPISRGELIAENRKSAQRLLEDTNIDPARWQRIWSDLGDDYFLRHAATEIVWHTQLLNGLDDATRSHVAIKPAGHRGVMLVLWYAPKNAFGFARATAALDALGLTILDARITSTSNDYSLDSYRVMEVHEAAVFDPDRLAAIERQCRAAQTCAAADAPQVTRRAPRRVRMFKTRTVLDFVVDLTAQHTVMEMTATDRPGLLSLVGDALRETHTFLHTAKITTVGERAENVFFLSDARGRPLSDEHCTQLQEELLSALETNAQSA